MVRSRILLADDHILVAEAFKKLLEPEFEVVGIANDGRSLIDLALQVKPDVIVLDIAMPLMNGMDAGRQLKNALPHARFIVLTMNEDAEMAAEATRYWASGYLLKKSAAPELTKAIHEVLKGKSYITPKVAQVLLEQFIRKPGQEHIRGLTPRQREVLQLLADGRTMKQAADLLHVTARTVAFHKYRIMEEFGLKTNSDLVRFAIREHVISAS